MDAVVARSMDAAPTGAPGTGEGARHVFVVGMPRSGTSLLEQVLSSHEGVFGCGEVETLALLEERLGGPGADVAARREAAAFYVQTLPRGHESARLTIDKQMLNFERVDFLLELFPGARLLWSRRHPLDTILSCYFQNFQAGINWSMDLDAIVATYIRHEAMMRHWMGRFPDPILAVRYEDLVDDLEGQARRLGDFLGIGFDPAMLSPHETERAVLTASNQQVRNPLYRSSMGYWRDYRNELTPAIAALREAGVELPGVDETA